MLLNLNNHNVIFVVISAKSGGTLSEETFEGRVLVRKEILRLVVQCASSVSTDSTEQALLMYVKS